LLEQGFYARVAANSGVQAIIGNPARFYPVILPESPTYPCASYQVISDVPEYTLDLTAGVSQKRIQVDTWSGGPDAASYLDAKNAQAAIRAALEGFRGQLPDGTWVTGILVANAKDEYEQDARAYRTSTDFLVFYPAAG